MSLPPRLREWLEQETRLWTREGLIDESQRGRLLSRYATEPEAGQGKMAFALRALGVIVLFAALLLVVSHNWEDLGRGGRMGMITGLLVGLQALAYVLHIRRSQSGSALGHLAAGLGFGAAIAMTGQVYHLDAHAPNAVLAWCLLTLPFVLVLDRTILHATHLALAVIWLGMKAGLMTGPGEGHELAFLALAAPSAWAAYRTPRASLAALVALAYGAFVFIAGFRNESLPLGLIVLPLALAALHPAGDKRGESWRALGALGAVILLLVIGDLDSLTSRADLDKLGEMWRTAPVLNGAALLVIALAALRARGSQQRADGWTAAGVLVLAEVWRHGAGHPAEVAALKAAANVGTLAMVVLQLRLGLNEGRLRPYLAGSAIFLVWLTWRYANIHESLGYLGMAAVFGVIGAALFALARLWRARAERAEAQPVTPLRPAALESLLDRLRPRTTAILAVTYALQLATLGWMVWHHGKPARDGERVLVSVEPVDPRDWMRGDYVILRYAFADFNGWSRNVTVWDQNRLAEEYWSRQPHAPRDRSLPEDTLVFVPYTVGADGILKPGTMTTLRPTEGRYLTGRWNGSNWRRGREARFGIEAYFVKEGAGKALEKLQREGLLLAEIGVLPDGRAGLIDLKPDPAPMRPVAHETLEGWSRRNGFWGAGLVYEDAVSFEKQFKRDGSPNTPVPDFTKHRVVVLTHDKEKGYSVRTNGNLIRITATNDRAEDPLCLLIPAGDEPVYGPEGRLRVDTP